MLNRPPIDVPRLTDAPAAPADAIVPHPRPPAADRIDVSSTAISRRLLQALGTRSARDIALLTGFSAETIRRYLSGRSPSLQFVVALATRSDISLGWLLLGRLPQRRSQATAHAISQASFTELFKVLIERLEPAPGDAPRPDQGGDVRAATPRHP
ncbi:MAG: helix-turn-helix domain-containing protein [Phycisphaerales bacterium]|nr:helix-turn-helix domain-containing protein [Phycisphaerales bacterium]